MVRNKKMNIDLDMLDPAAILCCLGLLWPWLSSDLGQSFVRLMPFAFCSSGEA